MGLMNAELYHALRSANVPEDMAEAAARSVASSEGVATKEDMAGLRTEMAELRADMAAFKAEIRTEVSALRADLIKWMVGLHAATWLALIGAMIAIVGRLP